jgi:chorismate dehydratase
MAQAAPQALRLGKIGFLNVLPIYYPLESGAIDHPFTIVSGSPAHLNQLMACGQLDLSAVSSIEYARHPERYVLIPDLSISSCGPVRSVKLFSRIPITDLHGHTIQVSTKSHTSAALLDVLFRLHRGMTAHYAVGNPTRLLAQGERPLAMLVIGDDALRLAARRDYPHRWDLGEVWHAWTGQPFVFGVWVVQRSALQCLNGSLGRALDCLLRAKAWGKAHLEEVCRSGSRRGVLSHEELLDYYRCLHFDLGKEEERGLSAFFHCLVEIGELREVPPIEVYSPLASVA